MTEHCSADSAATAAADGQAGVVVVDLQMLTIQRSENGFGFTLRKLPPNAVGQCSASAEGVAFDVVAVKPGSNAAEAGLRAGDGIVSVDGICVADKTLDQVVQQLQSCQGSVRLLVASNVVRQKSPPAVDAIKATMSAASAETSKPCVGLHVSPAPSAAATGAAVPMPPVAGGLSADLPPNSTVGVASLPVAAAAAFGDDDCRESGKGDRLMASDNVQTAPMLPSVTDGASSPERFTESVGVVAAAAPAVAVVQAEQRAADKQLPPLSPPQSPASAGMQLHSTAVTSKPTTPMANSASGSSAAAKTGSPRRPQQLLFDWPPPSGGTSATVAARTLGVSTSRAGAQGNIASGPVAPTSTAVQSSGTAAATVPATSPVAIQPASTSVRRTFRPAGSGTVREMAAALEAQPPSLSRPVSVISPATDCCSQSLAVLGDAAAATVAVGRLSSSAAEVEAPPTVTTTVTIAECSMETALAGNESSGDSGVGSYQRSAPRLPQRVLRAPVAVADSSGLSPSSPTGKCPEQPQQQQQQHSEQHSPALARPMAEAVSADVTQEGGAPAAVGPVSTRLPALAPSGAALDCSDGVSPSLAISTSSSSSSSVGVRFLPAYSSKPVASGAAESLASRITWQRKYSPGSSSEVDGGRSFTIRPAAAVSAGSLLGMQLTATVARSSSMRPSGGVVGGGLVRGRSGTLANTNQLPAMAGASAQASSETTRPAVVGRQQTALARRGSSGGSMHQQPLQLVQQQQQQLTCTAVDDGAKDSSDGVVNSRSAQHAHRADQLGHRAVYKSAPNIRSVLATTASADRLSDIDNESPQPPPQAAAVVADRPCALSDVVAHKRQRLGSADDTLSSRGDGSEREGRTIGVADGTSSGSCDRVVVVGSEAAGGWLSSHVPNASASLGSLVVASAGGCPRTSEASRSSGDGEAGSTSSSSSSDNLRDDRRTLAILSRPSVTLVPGDVTLRSLPPLSPNRPWSASAATAVASRGDDLPDFRASIGSCTGSSVSGTAVLVSAQQQHLRGCEESITAAAPAAAAASAASSIEEAKAFAVPLGAEDENGVEPALTGGGGGGSSVGGDDLHSIDSVQSCDSVDSTSAAGTRKESASSTDSLLRVPVNAEAVVRRRKSADVDLQAQLARRTSYIIATSPGTANQNAASNVAEAPQTADKDQSITDGAQISSTPRNHKQKLKRTLADKVPTIKESNEREQTAAAVIGPFAKEGPLAVKAERLDGKRCPDKRSWKSFIVSIAGHRLFFREKKESSSSFASLNLVTLEESPVDLRACKLDLASGNSKKKNTLRLETQSGTDLLLHASDIPEMMSWVRAILTAGATSEPADEPAKVTATVDAAIRRMEQQLASTARSHAQSEGPARTQSERKNSSAGLPSLWSRQHGAAKGGAKQDRGFPSPSKKDRKFGVRSGKPVSENELDGRNGAGDGAGGEPARAFGIPLSECSPSHENEFVPLVVEQCTKAIEERGLEFTGLYRVPGNAAAVKTLRGELNRGIVDLENERWRDVNVVGSLLKQFFRKLPEPLVTAELYDDFINANHLPTHESKLRRIKELVHNLPECNFETLKYLVRHLCRVASYGHVNKMEPRNLAICFGPTVIGCDSHSTEHTAKHMSDQCQIVESMLLYNDWVFAAPVAANEPVPPVCDDLSSAIPISETLLDIGGDIARITAGGTKDRDVLASLSSAAGQRLHTKDDRSKTRPSVSSEHSDGGASCDRVADSAVLPLQSPSPAEPTGRTRAEVPSSVSESGSSAVPVAATALESPIAVLDVVLPTAVSPLTAAGRAAPSQLPPSTSSAAVSPRPRRSGQGAIVRSPVADDSPSSEAPPVLPARRHGMLVDSLAAATSDPPSSPVSNNKIGSAQTMLVFADVIAATADRPPRPPRFGASSGGGQPEAAELASPGSDLSPVFDSLSLGSSPGCSRTAAQQRLGSSASPVATVGADRGSASPAERRLAEVPQSPDDRTTQVAGDCSALKSLLARSASLGASLGNEGRAAAAVAEPSPRLSTSLSSLEEGSDLMHDIAAELTDSNWRRLLHATESAKSRSDDDGSCEPEVCQHCPVAASSERISQSSAGTSQASSSAPVAGTSSSLTPARASPVAHGNAAIKSLMPSSSSAASSDACYRDPTLHKFGGQQQQPLQLGIARDSRQLQLVCENRPSVLDSATAAVRLPATYADDSCVDGSDCSVAKRRMSDERKRLRRRHTLGGGDHFDKFRDGNVATAQSAAVRGTKVAHSKTSWELLQQPSPARPVELAAIPALGLS